MRPRPSTVSGSAHPTGRSGSSGCRFLLHSPPRQTVMTFLAAVSEGGGWGCMGGGGGGGVRVGGWGWPLGGKVEVKPTIKHNADAGR